MQGFSLAAIGVIPIGIQIDGQLKSVQGFQEATQTQQRHAAAA
jgi:hypothetical protein